MPSPRPETGHGEGVEAIDASQWEGRRAADDGTRARSAALDILLTRLTAVVDDVYPPASPVAAQASGLLRRLREGRLQLAVLGQFKRGKSTLLNAVLGDAVLPAGVIPLTSVPTFISWGATPRLSVRYRMKDRPEEIGCSSADEVRTRLFAFVAEEANPRNRLGIERVDLFYPSAILEGGVVLIDTPGIGSTHRHNTDAALAVLPECDAAMFVVSPDPPITEVELDYLQSANRRVARLILILNKADYFQAADLRTSVAFLQATLQERGLATAAETVFCVSSRDGLEAKRRDDEPALRRSGLPALEGQVLRVLTREKLDTLQMAVASRTAELAAAFEADLNLRIRSLEMPLEDLERRKQALEQSLNRIFAEVPALLDLNAGDRRRAVERLEACAETLRQAATKHLLDMLDRTMATTDPGEVERIARDAIAAAIPDFFAGKHRETFALFDGFVKESIAAQSHRIDRLVDAVRRSAAELFEVPYAPAGAPESLKLRDEPYWVMEAWADRLELAPQGLIDRFLPADARQRRLRARLQERVERLVVRNVENLRWAILQGLDDLWRRNEALLKTRLDEAVGVTRGAIEAAVTLRTQSSERAQGELMAIRKAVRLAAAIRTESAHMSEPAGATDG